MLLNSPRDVATQPYDQSSVAGPRNFTDLFNAMIYPFTRTVVYGAIWYQGESNAGSPANYTCKFSKMIQYWRQTWNERTNGITDVQFPFGFVQVSVASNHQKLIHTYLYSYQPIPTIVQEWVDFRRFDGIKHLMLVMCQIMSFQKYLWLLLWIYVMIPISE